MCFSRREGETPKVETYKRRCVNVLQPSVSFVYDYTREKRKTLKLILGGVERGGHVLL